MSTRVRQWKKGSYGEVFHGELRQRVHLGGRESFAGDGLFEKRREFLGARLARCWVYDVNTHLYGGHCGRRATSDGCGTE